MGILWPLSQMRRLLIIIPVAAIAAFAAAPSAEHPAVPIPAGVTVDGVRIGGLTSEPARTRLRAAFDRPLRFVFRGRHWSARPSRFSASSDVEAAITRAFQSLPGAQLELGVSSSRAQVRSYVRYLDRRFAREPVNSEVRGVIRLRPRITPARPGVRVDRPTMTAGIENALRYGVRPAMELATKQVRPKVTPGTIGPVIVISRRSNRLFFYDGPRLVRSFGVATGRAKYPTPSGQFTIVEMQRNPWWRPPPSDWAKGLKPVPPGPGNPLGTRWMGTSAWGVGIHGTPDAASIGYSASHGCIRMQIPQAEWLFEHVRVGTPVVIV
jgi:lipoprotein-anchoring transpeptidase ErfK/SrfK